MADSSAWLGRNPATDLVGNPRSRGIHGQTGPAWAIYSLCSMNDDRRFRKSERLRLRKDFRRVFATRCSAGDETLVVYVARNGLSHSRLGMSVSRRVGPALRRNYIRRKIREAFRTSKADLPTGMDILCVARQRAGDREADLRSSLCKLTGQARQRLERSRSQDKPRYPREEPPPRQ